MPVAGKVKEVQGGTSRIPPEGTKLDESAVPAIPRDPNTAKSSMPQQTRLAGSEKETSEVSAGLREHFQASLFMEYATLLVAVVSAIFLIFLAFFGYLEHARYKEIQKELVEQRRIIDEKIEHFGSDLEKQRNALQEEKRVLDEKINSFDADLQRQRRKTAEDIQTLDARAETLKKNLKTHEHFLEAVLEHHSDLLLGIVEGFRSALNPAEDRTLRSLISEAEAALNLFYPDRDEVLKALLRLDQIGAESAVPSLVRLRDDETAETEIRIRAQQVLSNIRERLKEERRKK